jgi:two-component system sensor histidine kinase KdpD
MAVGLEPVPRRMITYRGAEFTEMDVDAVLARDPQLALVDELAHTNVPGSRNPKRYQDVAELLDAGIDVITTVNIQHLESLNDVVHQITGIEQRETIPDAVVRAADQVELVDMSAEALRRRLAHGNVYGPEKIDAALANYFRVGNLTALRELALLWLADKVDEGLQAYRAAHGINETWPARERVVVALTGGPEGEALIRRGARIAARSGSGLLAVHVAQSDGLTGTDPAALGLQRRLVESLGGSFHQVVGDDIATTILEFSRTENATQIVLGASRRSLLSTLIGGSTSHDVVRMSGPIDVHIVNHPHAARRRGLPRLRAGLSLRRRLYGLAVTVAGLPLLTLALAASRGHLDLTTDLLGYLLLVIVVSLVGGLLPAMLAAVAASLAANYYFTLPLYEFTIAEPNNLIALLVFVAVAGLVSAVVDMAARRASEAARASSESQLLATLAGTVLRGHTALPALLDQVREAFGLTSVTLLERSRPGGSRSESAPGGTGWEVVACAGESPCRRPQDADIDIPIGERLALAITGRSLPATDRRVLGAVAAQAATVLDQQRLTEQAAAAQPAVDADRMRTALLTAVGHDLRTPLAGAKAAVTALRSTDVDLTAAEQAELLAAADTCLDRLTRLVSDLLDMSRLQAGVVSVFPRRIALDELIPLVLDHMDLDPDTVTIDVPEDLPTVRTDAALLERVLANLIANAVHYSPPGSPPMVTGSALAGRVELRVVDHGPGIPEKDRDRVFAPFQRLGDHDNTTGVGLGLAVARGLTEALGGTLEPDDTPGGGLTMVISLPCAESPREEATGTGLPEANVLEDLAAQAELQP